ncbi:maleylpyruvate isomerase family mycothiol-dependent enzyme [Streptomyces sp. NRRL S-87]|uniref:maleylpyruvate isomerase family mycothiol-dependent enzyme n=1 Tax=Streptomyces sp. NRRL S-87 TaxID=1463920 RepID=UPI0004BF73A4|nr:maleylpyruvate isomerase family mycothiol-dependent enzyme [Streptomyces sp. NRRL S-87]
MPTPRKPRARSYDPAKTRAAVRAQFAHVAAAVGELTEDQLALPAGLGGWTVRDLAAHIAWAVGSLSAAAARPPAATAEVTVQSWPFATEPIRDRIEDAHRNKEAEPLAALYARTGERFSELLDVLPGDRLLGLWIGGMTVADFVVTRAVELVVHTDDLNRALGGAVPLDRQALATCVRVLADALAVKAPGGSVEVRVPPFAVVQCVEGPRHTRGTPPNVVETDPLTWIRLATGRLGWAEAVAGARVGASGERADLEAFLPVMS